MRRIPEDGRPQGAGEDELLSKRQLARRLGKSTRTIDYWRSHEGLPFLKIRHTVFFRWDEVMCHLEKTTGQAEEKAEGQGLDAGERNDGERSR